MVYRIMLHDMREHDEPLDKDLESAIIFEREYKLNLGDFISVEAFSLAENRVAFGITIDGVNESLKGLRCEVVRQLGQGFVR